METISSERKLGEKPAESDVAESSRVAVASQWQLIRWRFLRHRIAVLSMIVLLIFYLAALFAEFIAPYDATRTDSDYRYAPPQAIHFFDKEGQFHLRPFVYGLELELNTLTLQRSYVVDESRQYPIRFLVRGDTYEMWGLVPGNIHFIGVEDGEMFLLGTDGLGRDVLSRIIAGGRLSLSVGLIGIAVSFILGVTIGGISGYYGGIIDIVIQRIIEFIRSIPTIPLWMALSVALPPTWTVVQVYFGIVVILSLLGWTGLAREVRGKFMSLREEDFVTVARLHGAGEGRIIFKHLLPSFYSYIIASLTLSIPAMILGETALSFIGLGLRPPAISWGVLLNNAQQIRVLSEAPWLLTPAIFVSTTILAFNFVGDGLRDAADPYTVV